MGRKFVLAPIASAILLASAVSSASAVQGDFVYQQGQRAPFERAHTYLLRGVKTTEGCSYTYPPFRPPAGVSLWESRDLAVDDTSCLKIVEEGIPASAAFDTSGLATRTGAVSDASVVPLAGSTASGYAHAWYENLFGQSLTSDTTYLTWSYSGGCVTGSSTYGEWSWNTGYGWSLTSNNGSRTQTCAKVTGRTWSTYTLGGGSCHHYYTAVDAVGDASGGFTGSRSDSANCGPVWEHFQYLKTT
jgi:hypothetical protein